MGGNEQLLIVEYQFTAVRCGHIANVLYIGLRVRCRICHFGCVRMRAAPCVDTATSATVAAVNVTTATVTSAIVSTNVLTAIVTSTAAIQHNIHVTHHANRRTYILITPKCWRCCIYV